MRCAEARRRLLEGTFGSEPDLGAEEHLSGCQACSDWLEAADPLVLALRDARPADVPAPAGLSPAVLARLRGAVPRPIALGWMAAASLVLAALAAAGVLIVAAPQLARLTDIAGAIAGPLLGLVLLPGRLLVENPAWLAAGVLVTAGAWALWARLFFAILPTPTRVTR